MAPQVGPADSALAADSETPGTGAGCTTNQLDDLSEVISPLLASGPLFPKQMTDVSSRAPSPLEWSLTSSWSTAEEGSEVAFWRCGKECWD